MAVRQRAGYVVGMTTTYPEIRFIQQRADFPKDMVHKLPPTLAHFMPRRQLLGRLGTHNKAARSKEAWEELIAKMPWFRDWLIEGGPRPPDNWHPLLIEAWDTGLRGYTGPSPRQFGSAFATPEALRHKHAFVNLNGVNELCAFVHSMPMTEADTHKAAKAIIELLKHRQVFIWAANLDLSAVPMRATDDGIVRRLALRGRLETNPTSLSDRETGLTLPPEWTIGRLERCKQLPEWTPRSMKYPYYVAEPPRIGYCG